MNRKGFTLVELIAVIILISLIATIAIIPITKIIKDSKDDVYKAQIEQIILATQNWVSDHPMELPPYVEKVDNKISLTIDELIEQEYLDDDVINPKNGEKILGCSKVEITLNSNNVESYSYRYNFIQLEVC